MTWRRFQVLVRCLSPNSATVARLHAQTYIGGKRAPVVVEGAKAAEAAFQALFKGSGRKKKRGSARRPA